MSESQCHLLAGHRTVCRVHGWCVRLIPPGQTFILPPHTLTDLKQIGTLGGSIRGEDTTWIFTGLLNATAKTWGPTTMHSYSITSPGTISITQTQTAPPHSPPSAFQWHSLGNTGGVFNPKHGTRDAAKGCSHSATGACTQLPYRLATLPAPPSTDTYIDTRTHTDRRTHAPTHRDFIVSSDVTTSHGR